MLLLSSWSVLNAYVVNSRGPSSFQCNYRQNYAIKATDDDWGIVSSESIEEYESLLDLSSTIEPTKTNYNYLLDEWTLGGNDNEKENNTGIINRSEKSLLKFIKSPQRSNQRKWSDFDSYLEGELGDLDGELEEKDLWMQELRDVVEQKVGYAIWSKRSEKEIQKEIKKQLLAKGMNIPENIQKVIRAVYIERSHSLKQYKKENELACTEFRKWMTEQRRKTKKDMLPAAKVEVSKKWLTLHPKNSLTYYQTRNKLPSIILDECTIPVPGVTAFSTDPAKRDSKLSGNVRSAIISGSNVSLVTSNTPPAAKGQSSLAVGNTILTQSVLNWDKTKEDMPVNSVIIPGGVGKGAPERSEVFMVDDVPMVIANSNVDDYFVVL